MANTNLGCSAINCVYNTSGECYSESIKVDGRQATTTSHTCCSTFRDQDTCGFTNSADECDCVKTSNIDCKACNCKYNENENCTAPSVKINSVNASCETFCCK